MSAPVKPPRACGRVRATRWATVIVGAFAALAALTAQATADPPSPAELWARAAGCDPKDTKCDPAAIIQNRVAEQMRSAAHDLPAAMVARYPQFQAVDMIPRGETVQSGHEVDEMYREAACLEGVGHIDEARALEERAVARIAQTEPPDSGTLLNARMGLAEWINRQGQHAEAAERLRKAIAACESTHPHATGALAQTLEGAYQSLARIAALAGETAEAQRANAAATRYAGSHPDMDAFLRQSPGYAAVAQAMAMGNAQNRFDHGDHDALRRDLERAPTIDWMTLMLLERLELEAGNTAAAFSALEDSAEWTQGKLAMMIRIGLAARTGGAMVASFVDNLFLAEAEASTFARTPAAPPEAQLLWFWLAEQRKGRLFDALAVPSRDDGARASALEELRRSRTALATQFLRRFRPTGPQARCVDGLPDPALVEHIGQVEQSLMASTPTPAEQRDIIGSPMGGGTPRSAYPKGSAAAFVRDVAAHVPAGTRFVGYVRSALSDHITRGTEPPPTHPTPLRYAAFVVEPGAIHVVDLGEAAAIDSLVVPAVELPATTPAPGQPPDPRQLVALRALYDRIWRPLEPFLGDATHVFVAPDGALAQLPFAALNDGSRWLYETRGVSELRSARELLAPQAPFAARAPAVILANPAMPPAPIAGASFLPLKAAGVEGRTVQERLAGSVLRTGADADEGTLFATHGPALLHIATHAFFLSNGISGEEGGRGLSLVAQGAAPPEPPRSLWDTNEAWMRTAIVLAQTPATSSAPGLSGLATAYEIMATDLRGTELVTLSACETGRGELAAHHGIMSLQQAFLTAGAQSVLASLWQVDDLSTSLWMKEFYRDLAGGSSRVEAMTKAMDLVRARYPHPYHWAAFSLTGAIGPLRSARPAVAAGVGRP